MGAYFHAAEDSQAVRDAVFNVIQQQDFEVQATIMEKSKAQPQVRRTKGVFYKYVLIPTQAGQAFRFEAGH